MDKSYIFLKSPIGSGGEANIYTVWIRPELVAQGLSSAPWGLCAKIGTYGGESACRSFG